VSGSKRAFTDFENRLGVSVFEIPTMPPSVPGLRLKEGFKKGLLKKGVHRFEEKKVFKVRKNDGGFTLHIGFPSPQQNITTKGIVLASGRFLGGGLSADQTEIRETLFNLPVYQPKNRTKWHRKDFLDPRGHPVNQAGLEIDDSFRPLADSGNPLHKHLYAAGSILAHQDWKRQKCGSGLAIATAFSAVKAFKH
jgi:glycerol-3-phosphate dehydrogenase subunit B